MRSPMLPLAVASAVLAASLTLPRAASACTYSYGGCVGVGYIMSSSVGLTWAVGLTTANLVTAAQRERRPLLWGAGLLASAGILLVGGFAVADANGAGGYGYDNPELRAVGWTNVVFGLVTATSSVVSIVYGLRSHDAEPAPRPAREEVRRSGWRSIAFGAAPTTGQGAMLGLSGVF